MGVAYDNDARSVQESKPICEREHSNASDLEPIPHGMVDVEVDDSLGNDGGEREQHSLRKTSTQ